MFGKKISQMVPKKLSNPSLEGVWARLGRLLGPRRFRNDFGRQRRSQDDFGRFQDDFGAFFPASFTCFGQLLSSCSPPSPRARPLSSPLLHNTRPGGMREAMKSADHRLR